MNFLKKWLRGIRDRRALRDPDSPEYVPRQKRKVKGVEHPLVREKRLNKPKTRGVGIVYDANGAPKITEDWLAHLGAEDRRAADIDLAAHGWKINDDNTIVRA